MVGIKDFDMPRCCNSCSHWSFNRDDEPLCDLTYEYIKQFDKRQEDCPLVEAIPKAEVKKFLEEGTKNVGNNVLAIVREDYIHKADYENRLKADMVAMLTEIQLEIEKQRQDNPEFNIWKDGYNTANDIDCVIVQQKINSLKAESENP